MRKTLIIIGVILIFLICVVAAASLSGISFTRHIYIGDESQYDNLDEALTEVVHFIYDYEIEICSQPLSHWVPETLARIGAVSWNVCGDYVEPSADAMLAALDEIERSVLSDPLPDGCELQLRIASAGLYFNQIELRNCEQSFSQNFP